MALYEYHEFEQISERHYTHLDTRPPVKREFFFKNMNFFNKPFFDGSNPVVTL